MTVEAKRVLGGFTFWKALPNGRRITVLDHETQKPIVLSKNEVYGAQYGMDNLAMRVARILESD